MAKKQHSKPRASARKVLLPALCAAVLALAALAVCLRAFPSPFPRLEVAGFRITREEYLRTMYQARSDVLSDHAAAGISLTDWSSGTALGDPCELTMERALELLSEYYAVGTLAVERGYLADAGYEAMLEDLEEVNRKRQEALDSGGIVTGIPQFSLEDYITYRASNLRLQFCNDPDNPENQVTEEELLQRYEADRDNLYVLPDELDLYFLTVSTTPEEARTLKPELEALRELALEKGGLAPALEELPHLKDYAAQITVDQSSYSVYARSHGDILACAEGLQTGDISQVFGQEGWLCLVECLRRTVHNYYPLEDVESIVLQSIRESRYDALIAGRMEELEIRAELEALYRFTAEQLP